jgi:ferritin-like protein
MTDSKLIHPELAQIEVKGITRSSFLARSVLAAGAVYGTSAVTPFVSRALAQGGDVEILNFALTLEYLEAAFYAEGIKRVGLAGDNLALAKEIRDNEDEHVSALTTAIKGAGGKPVKAPAVGFGDAMASETGFLALAQTFEDTGVSAYNGAGPAISSPEVLGAAGSIVQVEARHAALIRLVNGTTPAPDFFDKPLEMGAVLEAVGPFVKG